jgi:hypothetical protein
LIVANSWRKHKRIDPKIINREKIGYFEPHGHA